MTVTKSGIKMFLEVCNDETMTVTYEGRTGFSAFSHCRIKIYEETEKDTVISSRVYSTGESGHGALTGFLAGKEYGVDTTICGGIGATALEAPSELGIRALYPGVTGSSPDG